MSQISQLQMRHIPVQDRILLRMNTQGGEEFLVWLTRRYVKLMWPILMHLVENMSELHTHMLEDPQAKKAIMEFQQEKAMSQAKFGVPFQEAQSHPLGKEPMLASKITIKKGPHDAPVLCMHPEQGQGFELALNPTLLHSFCKLLADSVAKAEWGLDVSLQVAKTKPPQQAAGKLN
ncbi:MAG: hypothetical protein BMS9Abin15_1049 [Gammaproteobacteria bacterium]|nr:MAG: hypothetical protein BMS9Abin15_1049 [Gammaproteobacteria bacterium]